MTLPFIANVFSVYAARRERTQYKIRAYIARVHVRGRRENWTVSHFLLTFHFNFCADCANGNYCFVNYTSRFPQFKFSVSWIPCVLYNMVNSTLFVLISVQITKALKNIRNALKMDMNQSLYLHLLALVLSSQKKVGIC